MADGSVSVCRSEERAAVVICTDLHVVAAAYAHARHDAGGRRERGGAGEECEESEDDGAHGDGDGGCGYGLGDAASSSEVSETYTLSSF